MPSCPELTHMLHSTVGLIARSVKHSYPHWQQASHGGHLPFRERIFSKSVTTFTNSNHMWCLLLIWWHLTILKWTGVTLGTLTMDIMWFLTLIILCLDLMTILLHRRRQMGLGLVVFLLDVYQIWDEVIWLTPKKGHLMSSAPICREQIEPSPEVSQQLRYNDWKQLGFLLQETM